MNTNLQGCGGSLESRWGPFHEFRRDCQESRFGFVLRRIFLRNRTAHAYGYDHRQRWECSPDWTHAVCPEGHTDPLQRNVRHVTLQFQRRIFSYGAERKALAG